MIQSTSQKIQAENKFCNRSIKSWLHENGIVIYLIYNEGKSVVAAGFIRTLKNKISKCITEISKNVYYVYNDDKLDNIVNKYNNTNQRTIKEKIIVVKLSTSIDFDIKSNDKDPKLKVQLSCENIKI